MNRYPIPFDTSSQLWRGQDDPELAEFRHQLADLKASLPAMRQQRSEALRRLATEELTAARRQALIASVEQIDLPISSYEEARKGVARWAAITDIVKGFAFAAVGGVISAVTFLVASSIGGFVVIAWGAVAVGAFLILRGVVRYFTWR